MICLYIYIYNIPFIFFFHDFHFFIYFPFICFHLSVIFIRFFLPQLIIYFHGVFLLTNHLDLFLFSDSFIFTRDSFFPNDSPDDSFILFSTFFSFFLFFVTGILTRWNVDLHLHVFLTCAHVLVRKRRRRGKKKELKFRKRPWNVRFLCG